MARELDKVKLSALLTASANGDEETARALLHDEEDGLVQTNVKDAVREAVRSDSFGARTALRRPPARGALGIYPLNAA
jgi:hypothetical protein